MKILLYIGSLFLMLSFGLMKGNGQTKMTEGRIVYSVSYISTMDNRKRDSLEFKEVIFWFKDKKQRLEFKGGVMDGKIILANDTSKGITEMGIRDGAKYAIPYRRPQTHHKWIGYNKNTSNTTEETKIIYGLKCNKVDCIGNGIFIDTYVYYTIEIAAPLPFSIKYQLSALKGYPMEFSAYWQSRKLDFTITSISSELVDDCLFEIPYDYKIITNHKEEQ